MTVIDIHYEKPILTVYKTKCRISFLDYVGKWNSIFNFNFINISFQKFYSNLASFGGIAGLFLGLSILSGVEIIYYLTIGWYFGLKRNKTVDKKLYRNKRHADKRRRLFQNRKFPKINEVFPKK